MNSDGAYLDPPTWTKILATVLLLYGAVAGLALSFFFFPVVTVTTMLILVAAVITRWAVRHG